METRFRLVVICVLLLTVTMVPTNVNAKTPKILYLYEAGYLVYGDYFASFGPIEYKTLDYVEYLADITQWLVSNNYDLVIVQDARLGTAPPSAAVRTIESISIYVKDAGKSLMILFGQGCRGTEYLGGFGGVSEGRDLPTGAETTLIVNHEVTTGVWKIYIKGAYTLSIHKGFLTPLAYAPKEWWGVSDVVVAGAVRTYGNGKVAYTSADDLIKASMVADNNRLMINVVNWLLGEPIGPEELPVELKNLQEEISRVKTEIDSLNAEMKGLKEEIAQLQQQKEEVINNLPLVKTLKQQIDDLNSNYNRLKSNYDSLKSSYDSLQANYNDLRSKYQLVSGVGELGTASTLMNIFVMTTIIFVATTVYFAKRKPKTT